MASAPHEPKPMGTAQVPLPRITIKFCVQCKWNLRAAYFAQELLQTFSTSIGEISLVPVTGGIFTVDILHATSGTSGTLSEPVETLLWDRKAEGGFPETKELKNRVRNVIDPTKDMGHIDRRLKKDREKAEAEEGKVEETKVQKDDRKDEDREVPAALRAELDETTISELTEALQRQKEDCEDCQ